MKTEQEIREEFERLKEELEDREMSGMKGLLIFERSYALKWVLDEEDDPSS